MNREDRIYGGLLGVIVGDALGVPVEFVPRGRLRQDPVTDMIGYGTYNLPPGSWSDDSSLTLCLLESLCESGYDLADAGRRFVRWYREAHWTPHGEVFDIGHTTREAILRLEQGVAPALAGPSGEHSNGNGSLMRIMPASLYFAGHDETAMREAICHISSLTHGHPRSQLACVLYTLLVQDLLAGQSPGDACANLEARARRLCAGTPLAEEFHHFRHIFSGNLATLDESEINSGGYVVSTLEASLWCLLNTATFAEAALKAVNLGSDSDTTGAVAGGLAGVYYGLSSVPGHWLKRLARHDEIMDLVRKFAGIDKNRRLLDDY